MCMGPAVAWCPERDWQPAARPLSLIAVGRVAALQRGAAAARATQVPPGPRTRATLARVRSAQLTRADLTDVVPCGPHSVQDGAKAHCTRAT
jgi:hypothetical protein